MRKRILPFALALVAAFLLCACGGSGNVKQNKNIKQNIQDGIEKLSSVDNCYLALRITINPQLEIYLDEEGTVLKTDAGNEDGENLLAALELNGLSYADAMSAVLSAAAEQNLLPEGAKIEVAVLASANGILSLEQTQQLEQVITDYSGELVTFVDQSIVVAENCGANMVQVETMANGDIFYSYFSNMDRIREICYGADGSYREWVYENKQTIATITVNADGTRSEERCSYEDGQMVYHSMQSPSGLEEETYYSDGTQKSRKFAWNDGSFGESHFDENGIMTYSCETNAFASMESYYYANGNPKTSLTTYPDGSVQERHFYESGESKYSRDVSPDGSVQEWHFYENGESYSRNTYPDGTIWEEECYENGKVKLLRKTYPDGTVSEEYYDEDGNRIEN